MPNISFDKTDITLLEYIQENGRASNVQLAEHLNLSETPCWRRLKNLEKDGIITGYQAKLNREKLGLGIMAFVEIKFSVHSDDAPDRFENEIKRIPEVLSCHNVTGEADYMLVIVSGSLAEYQELLRLTIMRLPGVTSVKSILSLKEIKNSSVLPLKQQE